MIETNSLPTPLALVVRRLNVCGPENSADTFLQASYVVEAAIKLLGVTMAGGLHDSAPDHAYRLAHGYVRADGLGIWEAGVRQATSQPLAGFLPDTMLPIVAWATRKRTGPDDDWFAEAATGLNQVFGLLGLEAGIPDRRPAVQHFLAALVQLRNKTKAHGAAGADFWGAANGPYVNAVAALVRSCPLFQWRWIHLETRHNGSVRGVWLSGTDPTHARDAEVSALPPGVAGVHFWPAGAGTPLPLGTLLRANRECSEFLLPNGSYSPSGQATFIDYGAGREVRVDAADYLRPPASLPPSETEGLDSLVVQSNVFGNLPGLPSSYVERPLLEGELTTRLSDRNHPIITLHGRGGIGKTSLALKVCHQFGRSAEPVFDESVWFSARDVDLRLHGPKTVRQAVVSLETVARTYGKLMGGGEGLEDFARALQEADPITGNGRLFIFDNFETMSDMKGVHEFLDTYTHLPNKVLITSRERAFKADFPIEVRGMEWAESQQLMLRVATELSIEGLLTNDVQKRIFEFAEGHPYVMRILVGELAKEGRYAAPKTLMPRRSDILDAVFQRSFQKLSQAGRWVFLLASNWSSAISETGLLVVLGGRALDAEGGIDECVRLSLISRVDFSDGRAAYVAPQVARLFGKKKLSGDPDRLLIQEDLELVRQFGVLPTSEQIRIPEEEALRRFAIWAVGRALESEDERDRLDHALEQLAEVWPEAWVRLGELRERSNAPDDAVEYALRRAVEDAPTNLGAWDARANHARRNKDDGTFIASRIRMAELDPDNAYLVREVAFDVCGYVTDHKEIPLARRSIYLASVRDLMLRLADRLDATGLSRLAWLFLLEENQDQAWHWASQGLQAEGDNSHCYKLIQRLSESGYRPK